MHTIEGEIFDFFDTVDEFIIGFGLVIGITICHCFDKFLKVFIQQDIEISEGYTGLRVEKHKHIIWIKEKTADPKNIKTSIKQREKEKTRKLER